MVDDIDHEELLLTFQRQRETWHKYSHQLQVTPWWRVLYKRRLRVSMGIWYQAAEKTAAEIEANGG